MSVPDDLTLIVGGREISGWEQIRVTRGIERCPNDFDICMSERYPGETSYLVIQPGDPCQVMLGGDTVINGYIDRFMPSFSARSHFIQVSGRGRCQDLIDCSAEWPGGQISNSTALGIAQKLAAPYGITVSSPNPPAKIIPQFNLNQGESAYEVIERVCRFSALLVYEGTDGNLVLSPVGTTSAACGFEQGINVEEAGAMYSMDQRFSEYVAVRQSVETLADIGAGGFLLSSVQDKYVPRHRQKTIIAESLGGIGQDIATIRAQWECSRRFGRSAMVHLKTDSWRDSAGALWEPNTLVHLKIPALKTDTTSGSPWLISEVSYTRDSQGTHAELTIMPPAAFVPEPIVIQPFPADVPPQP